MSAGFAVSQPGDIEDARKHPLEVPSGQVFGDHEVQVPLPCFVDHVIDESSLHHQAPSGEVLCQAGHRLCGCHADDGRYQLLDGPVNRLGDLAGHLGSEEQWGVDAVILTVLGLH